MHHLLLTAVGEGARRQEYQMTCADDDDDGICKVTERIMYLPRIGRGFCNVGAWNPTQKHGVRVC